MEIGSKIGLIIGLAALFVSLFIFYNTIITKRLRNKAPNESKSWYLWVFYYNPEDKRVFLPKRTGLGFTLNFARNTSYIILAVLIAAILIFILI